MVEAAELFNASQRRRTVAGIAKSLGEPRVSIVPLSGVNSEVVVTVAWDISWYQYRVAPGSAQPVRLEERGHDPDELERSFTSWNAQLDRGRPRSSRTIARRLAPGAGARRSLLHTIRDTMIYCVIPRELADELYDKMVEYYKDNPNVTVMIDRREGPDRRSRESAEKYGGQRELRDRRQTPAAAPSATPPIPRTRGLTGNSRVPGPSEASQAASTPAVQAGCLDASRRCGLAPRHGRHPGPAESRRASALRSSQAGLRQRREPCSDALEQPARPTAAVGLAACRTLVFAPAAGQGRAASAVTVEGSFRSTALDSRLHYLVHLPGGLRDERAPLPGRLLPARPAGRAGPRTAASRGSATRSTTPGPQGDPASSRRARGAGTATPSTTTAARATTGATALAHELPAAIDTRYRTIPSARGPRDRRPLRRRLGAASLGLTRPLTYAAARSWSGYVRADRPDRRRQCSTSALAASIARPRWRRAAAPVRAPTRRVPRVLRRPLRPDLRRRRTGSSTPSSRRARVPSQCTSTYAGRATRTGSGARTRRAGSGWRSRGWRSRPVPLDSPPWRPRPGQLQNFIGGEWVDAASGETFESIVPATGETIGTFPRSGRRTSTAPSRPRRRRTPSWRLVPAPKRGEYPLPLRRAPRPSTRTS